MRQKQVCKLPFFVKPISEIQVPKQRDAIYYLLRGIQAMHERADEITSLIMEDLTQGGKHSTGRGAIGMTGWQVFILSVLRMNLGKTFDQLAFDFNHNKTFRQDRPSCLRNGNQYSRSLAGGAHARNLGDDAPDQSHRRLFMH